MNDSQGSAKGGSESEDARERVLAKQDTQGAVSAEGFSVVHFILPGLRHDIRALSWHPATRELKRRPLCQAHFPHTPHTHTHSVPLPQETQRQTDQSPKSILVQRKHTCPSQRWCESNGGLQIHHPRGHGRSCAGKNGMQIRWRDFSGNGAKGLGRDCGLIQGVGYTPTPTARTLQQRWNTNNGFSAHTTPSLGLLPLTNVSSCVLPA
jgi:hypothetical protein